jgi:DNA-directed RNA polymerase subunit RPC12/RpoP
MDEQEDKIIVFDSYDTVMAANLVKTKLDAYGIPCFLSDENFVGLYPIRNELFPGVRLHVFEKDRERVKEILGEQYALETETLHCPYCQSQNVKTEPTKKSLLLTIVTTIMMGLFLHPKKTYRCQNCLKEFDSVPDVSKSSTP